MRLVDLNPEFVFAGGEGVSDKDGNPVPVRFGVGIGFDCPCPTCTTRRTGDRDKDFHLRVYVGFANPLDGGPPFHQSERHVWQRSGDTFDTLRLSPSILDKGRCGWHGYVGLNVPGEVTTC